MEIKGESLEEVETFTYLGSGIKSDVTYDVNCRIEKGPAAFNKLDVVWKSNNIKLNTKCHREVIYFILSDSLMYVCKY